MFDEKEKRKYMSEAIRNVGVAFVAGGFIAASIQQGDIFLDMLLVIFGFWWIFIGYKFLEVE